MAGCGCSRARQQPRAIPRSSAITITSRTRPIAAPIAQPSPTIQALDPDRLRIEHLRREAIRRSFGTL